MLRTITFSKQRLGGISLYVECKKLHNISWVNRMSKPILSSKQIALTAIFASLQAVLSSLPYTISIGVSGQITLGVIGAPLIGIIIGPLLGGFAVLIGSFISVFVNPAGAIFGILSVLPPTLGALGSGFMMIKRGYIPGTIILASLLVFYAHPFGREVPLYPFLNIAAMIVAFVFSTRMAFWSSQPLDVKKLSLGVPLATFVGTLTDHMFGSGLAIWYFNPVLTPGIWSSVMFVYPIERIVVVILTSIIAVPLYYSLRKAGLFNLIT
jgi:ABC-type Co2+ transport system permease subunit